MAEEKKKPVAASPAAQHPADHPSPKEVHVSLNDGPAVAAVASTPVAHATPVAPVHPQPTNGLGVAAMIVGIVAFVFGWVPFFGFLAGATAVVLGIISLKKPGVKGMGIAGLITGGLAVLWSLFITVFFIIAILAAGTTGVAGGKAIDELNKAYDSYNAENKALIEAKKDYKKGETATFGQFEVKVNSVKRDYVFTGSDSYVTPDDGMEYIVVNVTAKNISSDSKYLSGYDLKISEDGVSNTSSFYDVSPALKSGDVSAGATVTGNIVFEVTKGATDLKLQYETTVYDLKAGKSQDLVFTLAI
ncbi:MAG: DUF4190 domain-containing protein [Candidatus Microsaccharimonas sp.]